MQTASEDALDRRHAAKLVTHAVGTARRGERGNDRREATRRRPEVDFNGEDCRRQRSACLCLANGKGLQQELSVRVANPGSRRAALESCEGKPMSRRGLA